MSLLKAQRRARVCSSGCTPLKTGKNFSGAGSFWHLSCLKETTLGLGGGLVSKVLALLILGHEFNSQNPRIQAMCGGAHLMFSELGRQR